MSTPTLFTGYNMEVLDIKLETVVIPIETQFGNINVNIALINAE
jgi:CheY-specific phosphatase CheX